MSYLDSLMLKYRRREKRDVSLSRITTDSVSLASYKGYESLFEIKSVKTLKKQNKSSYYARQLLTEILPEVNNGENKKEKKEKKKRLNKSANVKKIKKIFNFQNLDKINEYDHKDCKISYYKKTCNIKRHIQNGKFISNFLSPMNSFISTDFNLYNDDYEKMATKICLKKKKIILPPKIPPRSYNYEKLLHIKQCKFKI